MNSPLPLYPGARPCIRCGWCCKQVQCGFGTWDPARHQCKELVRQEDGDYSCEIYDKIINGSDDSWKISPAFGAGCTSALNSDRVEKEAMLRNPCPKCGRNPRRDCGYKIVIPSTTDHPQDFDCEAPDTNGEPCDDCHHVWCDECKKGQS